MKKIILLSILTLLLIPKVFSQEGLVPSVSNVTSYSAEISIGGIAEADSYKISYSYYNEETASYVYTVKEFTEIPYIMKNLIKGTTYTARITYLVGGVQQVSWGSAPRVTFTTLATLSDPAISIINLGTQELDVNFTPITGATSYDIRYRAAGGTYTEANFVSPPYHLSELIPNTSYEVQLRSVDGTTPTDWSSVSTENVTTLEYLQNPSFTVNNITSGTAEINFSEIHYASGYEIQYYEDGTSPSSSTSFTSPPYQIAGLTRNTLYHVKLRTIDGAQPPMDWGLITAQDFTTLLELSDPVVTIDGIGTTSATISFPLMNGAESYDLQYNVTGTTNFVEVIGITSSYELTGLTLGTDYDIKVRSIAAGHTSSDWNSLTPVTFSTLDRFPDPSPIIENITSSSAEVQFDLIPGATSYQVSYNSTSEDYQVMTFSTLPYQLTGLEVGRTYTARFITVQDNPTSWGDAPRATFTTLLTNTITIDVTSAIQASTCYLSGDIVEGMLEFANNKDYTFVPESLPGLLTLQIQNDNAMNQNIQFQVDQDYNISDVRVEVGASYIPLNSKFYRILKDEFSQNSILELGPKQFKSQIQLGGVDGVIFNNSNGPFTVNGLSGQTGYLEIYDSQDNLVIGNLTNFSWDGTDGSTEVQNGSYKYKIVIEHTPQNVEINGDLIKNW